MRLPKRKTVIKTVLITLAAILLVVLGYLLYVVLSYYRVADNKPLKVEGDGAGAVPVGKELSLVTYNIGFGAYSSDYSFFMDGGKHSRAYSKQAVIDNTNGALAAVQAEEPDFVLFQEVDVKGTRSHKVNQTDMLRVNLLGYDSVFAQNYDSPYFLYPFFKPIGANKSGMMTFSRYDVESSLRRSLPIENSLYKYLDLDRAYSVSLLNTENGKKLALYNLHLSAYTSDGSIADRQLKMLLEDMSKQYNAGNYVIAAGDFNKDLLVDSGKYFTRSSGEFNWAQPFDTAALGNDFKLFSGSNAPSCRNADSPFKGDGSDFVLSVDGVIVSNNIEVVVSNTIDIGFAYSDHNPVKAEFILKQ